MRKTTGRVLRTAGPGCGARRSRGLENPGKGSP